MKKSAFAKANQLLRENKLEEAVKEYLNSIKEKKAFFKYENLGLSYQRLGLVEKAVDSYRKALVENKSSIRAKRYLEKSGYSLIKKKVKAIIKSSEEQLPVLRKKLPGSVAQLRARLLNLGFEEKATTELAILALESKIEFEKTRAAWELAIFYANNKDQNNAKKSIEWCQVVRRNESLCAEDFSYVSIIESECYSFINEHKKAEEIISRQIDIKENQDLTLALSQYKNNLNEKLSIINKVYIDNGYFPISIADGNGSNDYDSLDSKVSIIKKSVIDSNKVSIIIPAYEAENTILTTLNSLQKQTWYNIEVLIVDDCSPDKTFNIATDFANKDKRFKVFKTPQNSGPYVARNIALKAADGAFVTINDADDWSHPEKIEVQVLHLLNNEKAIANMSTQARITEDLIFYRRGNPGFYIQPNMSSLMFRREKVVNRMGYWDSVRFAADSEFTQRLKLHFGKDSIVNLDTPPLSFQRQTEGSLTGSSSFGYHGFKMGARKIYEEAHKAYHQKNKKPFINFPATMREFPAPLPMLPERPSSVENHYDVIIVSDFRLPGGTSMSNAEEIRAQSAMGLKTGIIQMCRYDMNPQRKMNEVFADFVKNNECQLIVYGQEVSCDLLVIRLPWILQEKQRYIPQVEAKEIRVIVNQPPKRDYGPNSEYLYNLQQCNDNLIGYFNKEAIWHPIGPLVREALLKHHADEMSGIVLSDVDWVNIINATEWQRSLLPKKSNKIRVCRHSRDQYVKWPDDPKVIKMAYPGSKEFNIYVMGGAETPKEVLGGKLPPNWKITEFGKKDPKNFLAEFDVFVYFTHPDWVESFGRVIFEAMAVGLPVILPPQYEPVFKQAAIYCEPKEVANKIKELMSEPNSYNKQVNRSLSYVREKFGYKVHAERLTKSGISLANKKFECSIFSKTVDDIDKSRMTLTSLNERSLEKIIHLKNTGDTSAEKLINNIINVADESLKNKPYSVVNKTTLPPSGDPHDYWHPAPYWWPNPNTENGLPFIRRDGLRVPGTEMYDPVSDKYDRTRIQKLFDESWALMLAWKITEQTKYADKAVEYLDTFFLNPKTKMNPNLNYAQVKQGHNGNQGSPTGIIELKDFYYYLDAVRLMKESNRITSQQANAFDAWLNKYLEWLLKSPQGIKESKAKNNHGTYYDLQVSAIAAFLGKQQLLLKTLQEAVHRIKTQFSSSGTQPEELERTTSQHYCCYNLQGWLNISTLATRKGLDIWNHQTVSGASLKTAVAWLEAFQGKDWPYEQIDEFDQCRFYPIKCHGQGDGEQQYEMKQMLTIKPVFDPHAGIRPFWNIL